MPDLDAFTGRAARARSLHCVMLPHSRRSTLIGCGTVYVTFEHPSFGTALMVGVGVMTLVYLLMKEH